MGFVSQSDYTPGQVLAAADLNTTIANVDYHAGNQIGQTAITVNKKIVAPDFELTDGTKLLHTGLYATGSGVGTVAQITLDRVGVWLVTAAGYLSVSDGYQGYWFSLTASMVGFGTITSGGAVKATCPTGSGTIYIPFAMDAYVTGQSSDVISLVFAQETALGGESAEVADIMVFAQYLGVAA